MIVMIRVDRRGQRLGGRLFGLGTKKDSRSGKGSVEGLLGCNDVSRLQVPGFPVYMIKDQDSA